MNPCDTATNLSIDSLSPKVQQQLAEVLESYLSDLERGLSPNVEDIVRKYPELAEPLRAYLSSLDFLHEATVDFRSSGQTRPANPDYSKKQLGDYTIVREIGRGGMGVVYEAKQISLDRKVALKVLPFAAVLDQRQIARFYNEAQAAAHLHHPNIVPVFSVGCDRGVHYYAMQYIDGQPLDLAIRQLRKLADVLPGHVSADAPTEPQAQAETADLNSSTWKPFSNAASLRSNNYFRTAATLGIEAAEALDHAHQCGIVHRDIKPSNLLLDDKGKVWITDFGLARFNTNGSLTATGDVMGTIRYMSPEQVAGKSGLIDHRTDVYSLGITLYELATLYEAFEGADRQAFLRWISDEEPRPPRQINPAIPVDFETILLKAISKSPQDRYATAKELADDLRHFIEGEPVLARRASLADRAAKWSRRHKTLVGAIVALMVVGLAGLVASTMLIATEHAKTKAALAQAETNYDQAQKNLHRAETHFRQLHEVVDRFGVHYAERLKDVTGAETLRREFLLDTLDYYRGFIKYAGDDPALQTDLALTYSKAAAVTEQIGDKPGALDAYRRATQILDKLAAAHPDYPQYQSDLALCYNNIGLLLISTGKSTEAEEAYQKALTIQKRLTETHPDSDKYQSDLALVYGNLGMLFGTINQLPKAEQAYRESIRLQEQLAEKFADKPEYLHSLAVSYNNLSFLQVKTDPIAAEVSSSKANSIQAKLADEYPANIEYQSDLALSYNNLGSLENHNGQEEKAEISYRRAIVIQEQLVRKSPSTIRFRNDLAVSHNNLGRLMSKTEQFSKANESFECARSIMHKLVDDYPNDLNYRSTLGGVLNNLGMVLEQLDRLEDAASMYKQAIECQTYVHEHARHVTQFRDFLGKHYVNYCRILRATGQWDKEVISTQEQLELWQDEPEQLYRIAVDMVAAAETIGTNKTTLSADEDKARQTYIELSFTALSKAIDAKLANPERIRDDPDLNSIRKDNRFDDLIQGLPNHQ